MKSIACAAILAAFMSIGIGASAAAPPIPAMPSFGANVVVLDPSMPQSAIQSKLDAIATQQVPNQFGTQRYAVFFEPGTYGSAADPLVFQVGYYTEVAGLGAQPGDVVINGAIDVFNQCSGGACEGTDNFWRSVSNLTLNVHLPSSPPAYAPSNGEDSGCLNSNDLFAVSQASPVRRVIVNGSLILQDYCGQGFVSGGYFADDEFNGGIIGNYGQQQWFTRNSAIDSWSNGVWNQVFLGDTGAPATAFGPGTNQYTTLATTPVSEEAPFLTIDGQGNYNVFVPAVRHDSVGPSYANGPEAGISIPLARFFVAEPSTPVSTINAALARGSNLLLTPGVYDVDQTIEVTHPHTVVLGIGYPTLVPEQGNAALATSSVPGIKLSGITFDAGPRLSPVLLQVGDKNAGGTHDANDPTLVQDVFFRIGGAEPGRATTSLVVNADNAILDDIWAWRADHGNGVGWTSNTADTGVVVNGDNVTATGLFVEHYQKDEVIWNGQNGEDVFFQNEMPYDPPSQAAWMSSPTTNGYPAFHVSPTVKTFQGYGMGSYSFFNQGVPIFSAQAFLAPTTAGVQFHDLLTIFLDATHGSGGISSVIDGVGGSSTAANPDTPVDVASYP
ncbi:MAG TPA: coagulation factor 5/8 type domain-containing protein [Gaiellaceae bacterium]|nr:coagulation factor 5/8 type domain-containing protein [Gaiellaceae bacterium]